VSLWNFFESDVERYSGLVNGYDSPNPMFAYKVIVSVCCAIWLLLLHEENSR
jgi:hypothetical protein